MINKQKNIFKESETVFETEQEAEEYCTKILGVSLEVAFKIEKIFYNFNTKKYYLRNIK